MSRAMQHLRRDARAWFGVAVVAMMVFAAVAAPYTTSGSDPS